jgi:adenine/guanine phosphoribosyltransferase-like PRPP-binding protein
MEGMRNDANLFLAFRYLRSLGREDLIKKRLNKGPLAVGGEASVDLTMAFLDYGTEQQAEEALKVWLDVKKRLNPMLEDTVYISERLNPITEAYSRFAKEAGLTRRIPGDDNSFGTRTEAVNAAMELMKKNYDVVIGILNSGAPLAGLMDFLGQNTRYAEWHHGWKGGPKWKKIGNKQAAIKTAGTILISEHDTRTGMTLKAFIPFLQKLHARRVDIAYVIDVGGSNKKVTEEVGYYDHQDLVWDLPRKNLVENLNKAADLARKKLKEEE